MDTLYLHNFLFLKDMKKISNVSTHFTKTLRSFRHLIKLILLLYLHNRNRTNHNNPKLGYK